MAISKFFAPLLLAAFLPLAVVPAHATVISCGSDCTYTGLGGSSLSDPTILPTPSNGTGYGQIAIGTFSGDQYYEFAWAGGPMSIGGSFDTTSVIHADLAIYVLGNPDPLETDGFNPIGNYYTAGLYRSSPPAGTYIVGIELASEPDSGLINFNGGSVDPPAVPEPASLVLLGTAVAALGFSRRRRLRRNTDQRGGCSSTSAQ